MEEIDFQWIDYLERNLLNSGFSPSNEANTLFAYTNLFTPNCFASGYDPFWSRSNGRRYNCFTKI